MSSQSKTVSFTPDQATFVDQCIASGRYQSASEVVHAGLRLLASEEEIRNAGFEKVRRMIDMGAMELDRGEEVDGGDVFRRLRVRRELLKRETQTKK